MLFDGEEMKLLTAKDLNLLRGIFLMGDFLTAKDLNLLRGIFLMGEMSKFLAIG